ncbi:MAG TPA: hypothetical protein VMB27_08475 [Solirubrobacteraceae bacterium]|nr:hypothetical protein [Solirubrobacteraceae bacterium]
MKKLVLAVAASMAAYLVIAPAAFAAGGWTSVNVPSTGNNVSLLGASARTNSDAWAVGQQFVAAGQPQAPAVAYHWNGTSWSLTPTPDLGEYGALDGVSASSATDAWAVGFTMIRRHDYGTLFEHWNGSAWSAASVDAITGFAARVTGVVDLTSTNAWAVGEGASGGLIEHWTGSAWSTVALPDPSFTPATGNAISADSANDVWVVGSTINPATEATVPEALHYNGLTWTVVAVPEPSQASGTLNAVTALSAGNAWAVGEDTGAGSAIGGSTLIEHWNGTAWSVVASPTPGAYPSLSGVAARSAGDVYAVGTNLPSVNGGPEQAMILRWNGSAWSVDSSGAFGGSLAAAATFPGASSEWAVGVGSSDQGLVLSHG